MKITWDFSYFASFVALSPMVCWSKTEKMYDIVSEHVLIFLVDSQFYIVVSGFVPNFTILQCDRYTRFCSNRCHFRFNVGGHIVFSLIWWVCDVFLFQFCSVFYIVHVDRLCLLFPRLDNVLGFWCLCIVFIVSKRGSV